jgi:putative ABC transport system substrate-binding protein
VRARRPLSDGCVATDLDRIQAYAVELVSLDPDVIFTPGGVTTTVMLQQTQTIPIVFFRGGVENGVRNISRPKGNATGIGNTYLSVAGKWVQILKDAVPRLARLAAIFDPDVNPNIPEGQGYRVPIEAAAKSLGVLWPNSNEASLHSRPSRMAASS